MGLGSSSLTMVELARAYSAFATYGRLVEPHWINRVRDRDDTVIEEWKPPEGGWPLVMDPAVAGIGHWLLRDQGELLAVARKAVGRRGWTTFLWPDDDSWVRVRVFTCRDGDMIRRTIEDAVADAPTEAGDRHQYRGE